VQLELECLCLNKNQFNMLLIPFKNWGQHATLSWEPPAPRLSLSPQAIQIRIPINIITIIKEIFTTIVNTSTRLESSRQLDTHGLKLIKSNWCHSSAIPALPASSSECPDCRGFLMSVWARKDFLPPDQASVREWAKWELEEEEEEEKKVETGRMRTISPGIS